MSRRPVAIRRIDEQAERDLATLDRIVPPKALPERSTLEIAGDIGDVGDTASHNDFLVEQTLTLQRKLRPYRRLQLRVRHRLQHSLTEHAEILAALRAGDADQAMAATQRHVVVQGERFADLLASLQLLTAA